MIRNGGSITPKSDRVITDTKRGRNLIDEVPLSFGDFSNLDAPLIRRRQNKNYRYDTSA
jgi:hypothetical protein